MFKLLVNAPSGEQKIVQVKESGGYFDNDRVIWDERVDGILSEDITLGKMSRNGKVLDTLIDFLLSHAEFVALQQAAAIKTEKKEKLDINGDLTLLRNMSSSEIDAWFDVNITNLNQATRLMKKVIKYLIKKDII